MESTPTNNNTMETESIKPNSETTAPPPLPASVRIEMRDPADLKPLPAVADLFAWADEDADFLAFADNIKEHGVLEPLLVTEENQIVDGRHRWRAAKRWQFDRVPVRVVSGREVGELVMLQLSTLAHRRHYTPSQRAFIMYPFVAKAHQEALSAHERNLKRGKATTISAAAEMVAKKGGVRTTDQIALELQLSRDTFDKAAKLHRIFEQEPAPRKWDHDTLRRLHLSTKKKHTIRAIFEPQILDRNKPMGLGAAIAGISSVLEAESKGKQEGGRPKDGDRQLRLFTDTFKDLSTRYEYWQNFDEEAKSAARREIRTSFEHMPEDLLKALSADIRAELKRREENKS